MVRGRDHLDRRRPGRRARHLLRGEAMHHNPERPGPPPSADDGVVLYEKRDRIAYVTINRPEARNAVSPEVHRAMIAAWADFAEDDSVDIAILTGAGEAFCAGADLKEYIPPIIADSDATDIREIAELGLNGFTRGMHRIYKPIIGAITAGLSPAASRRRSPATSGSPPTGRCSGPSRPGAASTTATAGSSGSSTP